MVHHMFLVVICWLSAQVCPHALLGCIQHQKLSAKQNYSLSRSVLYFYKGIVLPEYTCICCGLIAKV